MANKKQEVENRLDTLVQQGLDNPLISHSYLSEFYWEFNHDYGDGRIGMTISHLKEISEEYYEKNPLIEKGGEDEKAKGNPAYEAVKLMYEIGKAAKELTEILQEEEK